MALMIKQDSSCCSLFGLKVLGNLVGGGLLYSLMLSALAGAESELPNTEQFVSPGAFTMAEKILLSDVIVKGKIGLRVGSKRKIATIVDWEVVRGDYRSANPSFEFIDYGLVHRFSLDSEWLIFLKKQPTANSEIELSGIGRERDEDCLVSATNNNISKVQKILRRIGGRKADEALKKTLEMLSSYEETQRLDTIIQLSENIENRLLIFEVLLARFRDPFFMVRIFSIKGLQGLKQDSKVLTEYLKIMTQDEDGAVRQTARRTIDKLVGERN